MIILIAGASHTGKTRLAQRLLEKYSYPCLSIDHLKMGLIRSGYTSLTPESSDGDLTEYLWPVIREMVKTAIENGQNLIVEGCYIPFDWKKDFDEGYLSHIKYYCLVMSENIKSYADVIEKRMDDGYCTMENLLKDNKDVLEQCVRYEVNYILIDEGYQVEIEL